MPFPEDRGWKDTVWVDGRVELLSTASLPGRTSVPVPQPDPGDDGQGSVGQMLVNPAL